MSAAPITPDHPGARFCIRPSCGGFIRKIHSWPTYRKTKYCSMDCYHSHRVELAGRVGPDDPRARFCQYSECGRFIPRNASLTWEAYAATKHCCAQHRRAHLTELADRSIAELAEAPWVPPAWQGKGAS